MNNDKIQAILCITLISILFLIIDAFFVKIDSATTQLISTAIGGILGITVGEK